MSIPIYYVAVCDEPECSAEGPMEESEKAAISYGFKRVNNRLYCKLHAQLHEEEK